MATIERGPVPTDNFTMLSNEWIRDLTLSFKARGVLAWLSSHKVGFRVSLDRIAAASAHDGVAAVRSAVDELEKAGYLVRKKDRDDHGRITGRAYVLQDPNAQVTANMQFSHDGETPPLSDPSVGEPTLGNSTDGETAPLKKNISSKKTNQQKTTPVPPAAVGDGLALVGGSVSVADAPARRKKRTLIDPNFKPPVEAANKLAAELGVDRAVLGALLPEFVDYWIGEGQTKADWIATWRSSMRKKQQLGVLRPGGAPVGRSADNAADVLRREREARYGAHSAASGDVVMGEVVSG